MVCSHVRMLVCAHTPMYIVVDQAKEAWDGMLLRERLIIGQNKEPEGATQIETDQKHVERLLSLSLSFYFVIHLMTH